MRITLVTETYLPEVNGAARSLSQLVAAMQQRGHQLQVLYPHHPGPAVNTAGLGSIPLPFYPQVRLGLARPGLVARRLRRFKTELVHVATEGPLGLAALRAARKCRVPVASSFHTHFDQYAGPYGWSWLQSWIRSYLRWFHNRTAVTLVPSLAALRDLHAHGYRRLAIWSRGVDAEQFHPRHRSPELRQQFGIAPEDFLILYVGRLAHEKNLPELLTSFQAVKSTLAALGQRAWLALVGSGPLVDGLLRDVPPGVVLPGVQQGQALSQWYASADVFAFPSRTETFGNVVLEAQASGLPVVAFGDPVMAERIRQGVNGYLVQDGRGLVDALIDLGRNASRRQAMAAAARQTAEAQTWDRVFDDLEGIYFRILTEHPSRPRRSFLGVLPRSTTPEVRFFGRAT
jgi:glycosyltransferase involved in cell wall biosynthesis